VSAADTIIFEVLVSVADPTVFGEHADATRRLNDSYMDRKAA